MKQVNIVKALALRIKRALRPSPERMLFLPEHTPNCTSIDGNNVQSTANRCWLHANNQHQWAQLVLHESCTNTKTLHSYVARLAQQNEDMGQPIRVETDVEGGLNYLDAISVEHALMVYKAKLLTSGTPLSSTNKAALLQHIQRNTTIPSWAFSSGMALLYRDFRHIWKLGAWTGKALYSLSCLLATSSLLYLGIFHVQAMDIAAMGKGMVLSVTLPVMVLPIVGSITVWSKADDFTRSVSPTWEEVFAVKKPADAILLALINQCIPDQGALETCPYLNHLAGFSPREMMTVFKTNGMASLKAYIESKVLINPLALPRVAVPDNMRQTVVIKEPHKQHVPN